MDSVKDQIKKWLKYIRRDRIWLAEQCLVKKSSIDSWLKQTGYIPASKLDHIQTLMVKYPSPFSVPSQQNTSGNGRHRGLPGGAMVMLFSADEMEIIQEAEKVHPGLNLEAMAERYILDMAINLTRKMPEAVSVWTKAGRGL